MKVLMRGIKPNKEKLVSDYRFRRKRLSRNTVLHMEIFPKRLLFTKIIALHKWKFLIIAIKLLKENFILTSGVGEKWHKWDFHILCFHFVIPRLFSFLKYASDVFLRALSIMFNEFFCYLYGSQDNWLPFLHGPKFPFHEVSSCLISKTGRPLKEVEILAHVKKEVNYLANRKR